MPVEEFEQIVEYSFINRQSKFVVRFLDGKSYTLDINDLPKKMQSKKPAWEEASLAGDRSALLIVAGNEVREIASHVIHAKGKEV
jgi:hypothetical protein